ncbi:DUF5067 domain-containing protein [Ornithinibacillus sp. JPR2-1]|uniref:DUF5067 domain-containing protein n=1 Tax=Ornithinibacillus sp. JPR2-1 TaxID=2094019 RepID=UPI0031D100F3
MKKILFILVGLVLLLAACGNDSNDSGDNGGKSSENKTQETNNDNKDEDNGSEVSDTGFDNGDYVYEIKSIEQITGKYNDTQILAIEMSFTNNSEEATSPWMSIGIDAKQETDTTVETLTGANGQFPEDYKPDLVKMGNTDVKPGATVDAVIGFEILYPGEPVKLTNFTFTDEVLFEKVVETTEASE